MYRARAAAPPLPEEQPVCSGRDPNMSSMAGVHQNIAPHGAPDARRVLQPVARSPPRRLTRRVPADAGRSGRRVCGGPPRTTRLGAPRGPAARTTRAKDPPQIMIYGVQRIDVAVRVREASGGDAPQVAARRAVA